MESSGQFVTSKLTGELILLKDEHDDHFFFRKTQSITIRAVDLERVERVKILLHHRGVVIESTKDEIKKYKNVKTFDAPEQGIINEVKYHYPVKLWNVVYGDREWVQKLIEDFKADRLIFKKVTRNAM